MNPCQMYSGRGRSLRLLLDTQSSEIEPVALKAWAEKRMIFLELTDGKIFGFPSDRFLILSRAPDEQLKEVQLEVGGHALRWEELDEDLTVAGEVAGRFQSIIVT